MFGYLGYAQTTFANDGIGPDQTLSPSLLNNGTQHVFYQATLTNTNTLQPALFTNTQTFFPPEVSRVLSPGLFTNSQTFHGPTVTTSNELQPGLFANSHTFHSPTVVPGTVTITPSLVTNISEFFHGHSARIDMAFLRARERRNRKPPAYSGHGRVGP